MAARAALRKSSKIRSAARQFWTTCGLGPKQTMSEELYTWLHRRIAKMLAPELTEHEAQEAAAEDWHMDGDGANTLSFDQFALGLFGIADMWCEKSGMTSTPNTLITPRIVAVPVPVHTGPSR